MSIVWRNEGDGRYRAIVDGEPSSYQVFRRDEVTPGYWGRWKFRRQFFERKRDAVAAAEKAIRS